MGVFPKAGNRLSNVIFSHKKVNTLWALTILNASFTNRNYLPKPKTKTTNQLLCDTLIILKIIGFFDLSKVCFPNEPIEFPNVILE